VANRSGKGTTETGVQIARDPENAFSHQAASASQIVTLQKTMHEHMGTMDQRMMMRMMGGTPSTRPFSTLMWRSLTSESFNATA
jgi:hypothetical protein